MSRVRLLSLFGIFCLALPLFLVPLTSANVSLSVTQSEFRISLQKNQLAFPIENSLSQSVPAILTPSRDKPAAEIDKASPPADQTTLLRSGLLSRLSKRTATASGMELTQPSEFLVK